MLIAAMISRLKVICLLTVPRPHCIESLKLVNLCLTDWNLRLLVISHQSTFIDVKESVRRKCYKFKFIDANGKLFTLLLVVSGVNLSIHQGSERFITF